MMYFPASNRVLLQRVVASVMVLAVITACSRPDRTESGSSSDTAAVMQDTLPSAGDTATASVRPTSPRAATASPTRERRDATSRPTRLRRATARWSGILQPRRMNRIQHG